MASAFPNLPGFVPDSKQIDNQWFRRVSANQQEKNKDRKNVQPTLYPLPRWNPPPKPDETGMHNGKYLSTTHDSYRPKNLNGFTEENSELYQPDFVKMDRHTLRFYGYFKESCVETPLEAYRTRRVIVYFYLEDNSVQMIEPKQQNSGIPQGVFLRRQKVLRADESGLHISVDDFRIGQDTMIFGKNVHIYDCDVYTREFYENYGQPQGLPESFEEDAFAKSQVKIVPNKDYAMKDYMEHKLGGGKVSSAKQFLENDRKVLKFYVFSQIPFILHFFLADDTVEIREINFQNSGRDPFPVMLRRQKLPRKFALNQPGQTYAEDFVRPEDIKYGEQLEVYGRKFLVNGCDPFTARFFKEKFGVDFPVSSIEQPQPKDLPDRQIPPYNGFGDEEDSLGYVYRLIPKAPRKDFFKWVDNQVNLRFVARLNTKNPEDVDRRFIITFFLNDETIQVFEPSVRNSGQIELYMSSPALKRAIQILQRNTIFECDIVVAALFDCHYCYTQENFISLCAQALTSQINLELPHINILSKIDLMSSYGPPPINFANIFDPELSLCFAFEDIAKAPQSKFIARYRNLNKAISDVIDQHGLLNFLPLRVEDMELVANVSWQLDKANGYAMANLQGDGEMRLDPRNHVQAYEPVEDIIDRLKEELFGAQDDY